MRFLVCALCLLAGSATAETRIIDGDTFELDGTIIRIEGIDAPEHGQKCGNWACGKAATDALAGLVEGAKIACDTHTTDQYGRAIASCTADGADLGKSMVDKGLAWPFEAYSDSYLAEGAAAKAQGIGIWSGEAEAPWDYRAAKWASAEEGPNGCRIKGNISDNGHIYHAPWSPWYSRTKINLAKGERWFCDEAEAQAAGWRAPYWR